MDAARTALRLGAEVHIIYRRSEEELPARVEEVHHAKEEGIIFDLLTNPTEILVDDKGWVKGIKCVRMELGEPDASGRISPVEIPGLKWILTQLLCHSEHHRTRLYHRPLRVLRSISVSVSLLMRQPDRHPRLVYLPVAMP